jgi:hypothetical protein
VSLAEPDAALTDFGVAVEAAILAGLIARRGRAAARRWWTFFFGALAIGALLGGIEHGFFPDGVSLPSVILWRLTLLALGLTALAAWGAGTTALARPTTWIPVGATGLFVAYALAVLFVTDQFGLAMAHYLPAALFLLAMLAHCWWRAGARPAAVGVLGLVILLAGSWVQWRRIPLHPVYFTHNALDHLIEAVALLLLYRAARWLVTAPR